MFSKLYTIGIICIWSIVTCSPKPSFQAKGEHYLSDTAGVIIKLAQPNIKPQLLEFTHRSMVAIASDIARVYELNYVKFLPLIDTAQMDVWGVGKVGLGMQIDKLLGILSTESRFPLSVHKDTLIINRR